MVDLGGAAAITFVLTADRARSMPFYTDVIGLKLIDEDPFAATFALSGGATMRLTTQPGHTPAPHTVLGWAVADIRATIAALRDKGVAFNRYDGLGQDDDGVWTAPAPDGATMVAWFPDPEGNVLSLTQF